ncbi:ATP-binding protein [Rhodobacteraceae bacterium CCMM004]|nr:ATP-binding protein [Rhodobacteraceae bacterium CCMM004]
MQTEFLDGLSDEALLGLPYLFDFWALPHQLPPEGDWRTWVILGGRGAGKTRAGAEWVRTMVEGDRAGDPGRARRVALVGETMDQVRGVMIEGESGILACSPPDRRPVWEAGRHRLVWPNGAIAVAFSAHEPDALRGPQFDAAWVDELAKWKKGQEAWDMLQFCLRLGDDPRACVTTTPRNVDVVRRLLAAPSTVTTHAPTEANRANLAASFLEEVRERYGQTRLGRQELMGEMLGEAEGALWTAALLTRARAVPPVAGGRVVVAVDPPVTGKAGSDLCGIVAVGADVSGPPETWRAEVLEDCSVAGSPTEWAAAAVAAYRRHGADRMVAEVNQGGDLVEMVIRQVDPTVSYRSVHATRGKHARAEPVAALYEQGRVRHAAADLGALEDQMVQMTAAGWQGTGSPDRLDALVWALHELILAPRKRPAAPQVRMLG